MRESSPESRYTFSDPSGSLEMRNRVETRLERLHGPVTQQQLLQSLRAVAVELSASDTVQETRAVSRRRKSVAATKERRNSPSRLQPVNMPRT